MYEEVVIWHEIVKRELTQEEKEEYRERGDEDNDLPAYIFACDMPDDGEEILIATGYGVSQDVCCVDCDECNNLISLETNGDWDDVRAWAAMPTGKKVKQHENDD